MEQDFVKNAAHELRTPVSAISSAIEVLQDGAKNDPEARDRLTAESGATFRSGMKLVREALTKLQNCRGERQTDR